VRSAALGPGRRRSLDPRRAFCSPSAGACCREFSGKRKPPGSPGGASQGVRGVLRGQGGVRSYVISVQVSGSMAITMFLNMSTSHPSPMRNRSADAVSLNSVPGSGTHTSANATRRMTRLPSQGSKSSVAAGLGVRLLRESAVITIRVCREVSAAPMVPPRHFEAPGAVPPNSGTARTGLGRWYQGCIANHRSAGGKWRCSAGLGRASAGVVQRTSREGEFRGTCRGFRWT